MNRSFRIWLRGMIVGTFAGALTGILSGLGARVAMRVVVDNSPQMPRFTPEGTLTVVLSGILIGTIGGALYGAMLPLLHRAGGWRGALFGVIVTILVFGQFLLATPEGEAAIAPEWIGKTLFVVLTIASGVVLAKVEDTLESILAV